eukprot:scaffold110728_cov80-Phaeocystis_antarctica.AAC.2
MIVAPLGMRRAGALCLVAVILPLPFTRRHTAPSASRSWRKPWALARERVDLAAALLPYQRAHSIYRRVRSACPRVELAAAKGRLRPRCARRWKSNCPAPKMTCEVRSATAAHRVGRGYFPEAHDAESGVEPSSSTNIARDAATRERHSTGLRDRSGTGPIGYRSGTGQG